MLCSQHTVALPSQSSAQTLFGLRTDNTISRIDSADPTAATSAAAVLPAGLNGTESLIGIDYRPATGEVYTISDAGNVYTLDQTSFAASLVGSFAPAFSESIVAFDFNPALGGGEFARIIGSTTQDNSVISGESGDYLFDTTVTPPSELRTDVFYAQGDANEGATATITGIAYDTNIAVTGSTLQFGIDSALGTLVNVANNAGTLTTVADLDLGALASNEVGFDIDGLSTFGFLSVDSALFTVDLADGSTTSLGTVGGLAGLRDITAVPIPEPTGLAVLALAGIGVTVRRRKQI